MGQEKKSVKVSLAVALKMPKTAIIKIVKQGHEFSIVFDNKDQICITKQQGRFHKLGTIEYFEVKYLEQSCDDDGNEIFYVTKSQYFPLSHLPQAVKCFNGRFHSQKPYNEFGKSYSLDEVAMMNCTKTETIVYLTDHGIGGGRISFDAHDNMYSFWTNFLIHEELLYKTTVERYLARVKGNVKFAIGDKAYGHNKEDGKCWREHSLMAFYTRNKDTDMSIFWEIFEQTKQDMFL